MDFFSATHMFRILLAIPFVVLATYQSTKGEIQLAVYTLAWAILLSVLCSV